MIFRLFELVMAISEDSERFLIQMTRGVLIRVDDDDGKELQKLTQPLRVKDDDEMKVNGTAEEVRVGEGRKMEAPDVQEQPQGASVCWERFLHLRSLKVLLVENDDSTRHIVTALLRNCSYEVIEAANGLQAWKILEDLTNHIDLILTEVEMPCVSGIGLLCKIMSHKTRKNIPIIMMSSRDSMGLVFKCLSKGAVDFLVKPIRKNELKNVWQHVWRRCHSSSGSASGSGSRSESGTQTQKSVKSKSLEKSYNNTSSNDKDNDGAVGLNISNGSYNGSGTQSSWTEQAAEVDSAKQVPQWDQISEYPDSSCAQVIHSNTEIDHSEMIPTAIKYCSQQNEHVKELKGRELESYRYEVPVRATGAKHSIPLDIGSSTFTEKINKGQLNLNSENPSSSLGVKGPLVSVATNGTSDSQMHGREFEAPNGRFKSSDIENKAPINIKEFPSPETSLKRLRGVNDAGITVLDERNVIRRSDLSAFSRFNASSDTKKSPIECMGTGSNSPHNNSLEVTMKDSPHEMQSHSSGNPPPRNSNDEKSNIDMGSTTNNAFTKNAVISEPVVASTAKVVCQSSAFQPMKNDLTCTSELVVLHNNEDMTATTMVAPRGDTYKGFSTEESHHHYETHDDSTLREMAAAAPQCGSSNVMEVLVEGNVGNYSVNGSASGSNNGSNGKNGSSTAVCS